MCERDHRPFSLDDFDIEFPLHVGGSGVVNDPWTTAVPLLPDGSLGASGSFDAAGMTASAGVTEPLVADGDADGTTMS